MSRSEVLASTIANSVPFPAISVMPLPDSSHASEASPARSRSAPEQNSPTAPTKSGQRKLTWSWTDVNFWLDALLLVNMLALGWCAAIVHFVFPPGLNAKGWTLWGADYNVWARVEFGLLAALATGVLIHVTLHWSWVCNVIATRYSRSKKGRIDEGMQTIYGVGFLILLLHIVGIAVAVAALMIQSPA